MSAAPAKAPARVGGAASCKGVQVARSLDEVARMMGLTRQRVQQIEERALKKVRAAFEKMGVNSPDDVFERGARWR